ncbi:MAG: histidinol-phosphate transaminase [Gemmatimonadota bacterium]|jgi:histidinol-phosphate aminotransferase|nr:histidinol-phosphate transaminase [Gemmatimonadota bacterium]
MTERVVTAESVDEALRLVKPVVRGLGAYTLRPYEPRIKLNQNESPYDVPEPLKRRLWERLADRPWNRYPPFVAADFIAAVSEVTGWPEAGVLVGNGSNELIQALLSVVVEPGVSVVIPEPTFTLYQLVSGVSGGTAVSVALDEEMRFRVDAIIEAARTSRAAMIVLCTPNNPTGRSLTREEIERIYDSTDALIVLDQAYVEFGGYNAIPLLAGRPRLVVLRTFSKAMAMAGLRAGYLLAHPELATEIAKAKLPYNVNFVTETIAAEMLRAHDLLQPGVDSMSAERDRIIRELSALEGLTVFPSDANFVLFRVEHGEISHTTLFNRLLEEDGILVRDVSKYPMLEHCLRVSTGTPEENDAFLAGIRRILGQ